jgi:hypothetical protein
MDAKPTIPANLSLPRAAGKKSGFKTCPQAEDKFSAGAALGLTHWPG